MDEQRTGRQLHRYRSKIAKLTAEVKRLRRIEHAAWHALDASEETNDSLIVPREEGLALSRLLPEDHPGNGAPAEALGAPG